MKPSVFKTLQIPSVVFTFQRKRKMTTDIQMLKRLSTRHHWSAEAFIAKIC